MYPPPCDGVSADCLRRLFLYQSVDKHIIPRPDSSGTDDPNEYAFFGHDAVAGLVEG